MHQFKEYADSDQQAAALAVCVAAQLRETLAAKGRATLAVPGGTTPGRFLVALSRADIDWPRVSVLLTDERFVPQESPRSNTRLLRETLLQNSAAKALLVPLFAPARVPEEALARLSDGVRAVLPLDVCVLGMGADMHIASLFPGADRLAEALAPDCPDVLLPMRAAGAPEPRLTLTAPVLSSARHLHLLIKGRDKRAALDRAGTLPAIDAPVAILMGRDRLTVHFTERDPE
ncbi:MAG: 6-phosphogluconolactonase [Rhodobacteraceae bacterium]|nr:6-phosphogluconolactonase [Paracoccaceae bacterium]